MPEPDCFLRYRTVYALQRGILLRRKNPTYRSVSPPVAAATRGFKMVLFTANRGNNFVGGKCAPPSALLVTNVPFYMYSQRGLTLLLINGYSLTFVNLYFTN